MGHLGSGACFAQLPESALASGREVQTGNQFLSDLKYTQISSIERLSEEHYGPSTERIQSTDL